MPAVELQAMINLHTKFRVASTIGSKNKARPQMFK